MRIEVELRRVRFELTEDQTLSEAVKNLAQVTGGVDQLWALQ